MKTFDGSDYVESRDFARLGGQLLDIVDLMSDGKFRTLEQISRAIGAPEASVSAQLRNLRKARFGSWIVEKSHMGYGLYVYKLIDPREKREV